MISVCIIDNDRFFINSSTGYLRQFTNLDIKSVYTSIQDYKKDTSLFKKLDVLFIDCQTIDLEEVELIKKNHPNCKVIMLSNLLCHTRVIGAIKLGISGYLIKTGNHYELYNAVMVVFSGGCVLAPHVTKIVLDSIKGRSNPAWKVLTKREQEFARELLNGSSYKQIGNKLFVSPSTVSFHLQNLYLKLDVRSKAEFISKYHSQVYS